MKKLVLAAAAGMLAFGASAVPAFAAESGSKEVTVGYDANSIVDPENPSNPDWSVSVPKSFNFTDAYKTNAEMGVKLNTIQNGGLATGKSVDVSVASANSYKLINGSKNLDYTLTYPGGVMASNTTSQAIGTLENIAGKDAIAGTAVLTGDTATADGVYKDTLTYTVSKAK